VRPMNLVAAADETPSVASKQGFEQPSAAASCEADQSSAAAHAAVSADPTLFVKADRFVQPAANGRENCDNDALERTQEDGCEVHRTQLPAGHWRVWSLEHSGPHVLTATLVACERREVEEQSGLKDLETWDELKGLVITRVIHAVDAEVEPKLLGVDASVDGGVLKVLIPIPREQGSSSSRGAAPQQSEAKESEVSPTPLGRAASLGVLDRQESDGEATAASFDGAWWSQLDPPSVQHKAGRVDFRRPLFVRRSQSLDAHGRCRRSRKQANARRRAAAASSESRRCLHGRPGAPPRWKTECAVMAAAAGA